MNHEITYQLQDIFNLLPDVTNPVFVRSLQVCAYKSSPQANIVILFTSGEHERPDAGDVHCLRDPVCDRLAQPHQQQAGEQGGGEEGGQEGGGEGAEGEKGGP